MKSGPAIERAKMKLIIHSGLDFPAHNALSHKLVCDSHNQARHRPYLLQIRKPRSMRGVGMPTAILWTSDTARAWNDILWDHSPMLSLHQQCLQGTQGTGHSKSPFSWDKKQQQKTPWVSMISSEGHFQITARTPQETRLCEKCFLQYY